MYRRDAPTPRLRRDPLARAEQVVNADRPVVPLTPVSEIPTQMVRAAWAAAPSRDARKLR